MYITVFAKIIIRIFFNENINHGEVETIFEYI